MMKKITLDDMIKALKCVASQDAVGDCYADHENFIHIKDDEHKRVVCGTGENLRDYISGKEAIGCPYHQNTYGCCFEDGELYWLKDVAELLEELKELRSYKEKMELQYLDDIGNPLEPLKLSSALESEIIKYNYRKENKPKEINMLDYTVMYALEILFERKAKRGEMMERLTERIKRLQKDDLIVYTNGKYEDTIPAEMTNDDIRAVLKKLADYEDLEEQGLLVRLPCKVGDTVYRVDAGAKQPIIPMTVSEIHFLCYKNERAVRFDAIGKEDMGESCYRLEDIGRIVFLTHEEAEKKLEESQNDKT